MNETLRARLLTLGRWGWVLATCLLLAIFLAGVPLRFDDLRSPCHGSDCSTLTITETEFEIIEGRGLSRDAYAIYHVGLEVLVGGTLTLLAGLIFWKRSDSGVGLLVAFTVMFFGLNFMMEADSSFINQYPDIVPAFNNISVLGGYLFILLFFLFPDGSFVPSWTRWVAIGLGGVMLLDGFFRSLWSTPSQQFSLPGLIAQLIGLALGLFAQVHRYRTHSNPTERQQTKWIIFGLVGTILAIFTYSFYVELFPPQPGVQRLIFNLGVYSLLVPLIMLFPISFVFSVMRYRLWDIDLIVRRTLSYSILTATLAVLYVGAILLLQRLVLLVGRESSPLTTVISTLFIAALFSPLQTRIQDAIDRRFYRAKYDMQRTLAGFADTAREEVDLDLLAGSMLAAVDETLQPDGISLWINKENYERS